jgi:hypothetical protein
VTGSDRYGATAARSNPSAPESWTAENPRRKLFRPPWQATRPAVVLPLDHPRYDDGSVVGEFLPGLPAHRESVCARICGLEFAGSKYTTSQLTAGAAGND